MDTLTRYADVDQRQIAEKVLAAKGARAQQHTYLGPVGIWHNAEDYLPVFMCELL